jgi:uncharacterized protein (DUF58 family)
MRIKSLELRAKIVVEGFWNGLHRSPRHGSSVEFTEYRQYTSGDDPRYLDWKFFARSDRYYVKRYEDETTVGCRFLFDASRSMEYGSQGYTKADYAATLTATLAYFLDGQRDAVGLVSFADRVLEQIPARRRRGHLQHLLRALDRRPEGTATQLRAPLERVARQVGARGVPVLISDLLAPLDDLEAQLGYLRTRGHDVIVLQILDPVEVTFDFEQPALFQDVESGRDLHIDPAVVRADYLARIGAHFTTIETACAKLGIDYRRWTIDMPLEEVLFDFLRVRGERGRGARRNRPTRTRSNA